MAGGLLAVGVLSGLGGCAAPLTPVDYARPYPAHVPHGPTLDIQVFRRTRELELTNTTARALGPSTLWLNAYYSRPIDGLGVGQTLMIPLVEFRNEFSEAFRGGGFFATEAPERLVMAQLETEIDGKPQLLGMIVVAEEDK